MSGDRVKRGVRIAVAFPGLGADVSAAVASVRRAHDDPLVRHLRAASGASAWDSLEEGDIALAQPAVFVASLLNARRWRRGCLLAMGHSLGEITSLCFSGGLDDHEGLALVIERGRICAAAARRRPGVMVAVLGMPESQIQDVVLAARASSRGTVDVAARNGPHQTVLSGDPSMMAVVVREVSRRGGTALRLPIGGAFHSTLMTEAREAFGQVLDGARIDCPVVPWLCTTDTRLHDDPRVIRSRLREGLVAPVQWERSLKAACALGVDEFVDAGPGDALVKLHRGQVQASFHPLP